MKVGILGAGIIAEKMAFTLNEMEGVTCYAVGARDIEKSRAFAEKFHIDRYYGSYMDLVKDPDIELIYVATPHSHHYEHAKLCLENGKAVLCEKAFTANAPQAEELIRISREKKVFLAEAMWTRYLPSCHKLREIIRSGAIGEVTFATANLRAPIKDVPRIKEPVLAGGALLDLGIYPLTFIRMIIDDEIEDVVSSCTMMESGVDEQEAIILKFKSGKMGIAHCGVLGGTEQQGIIYGTKGYLIAEEINNIKGIKQYDNSRNLVSEWKTAPQISGFEYEVQAAVKAIQSGEIECREMPQEESLYMMKLMDNIRREWGIKFPFE